MKTFKDIREARGDTCVFTFGRFNPPTTGHEKLIEKVASVAKANQAFPSIFLHLTLRTLRKTHCPIPRKLHT